MKMIHWNLVEMFSSKTTLMHGLLSAWKKWTCTACYALYHTRALSLSGSLHIATVLNSYKFPFLNFFCLIHLCKLNGWIAKIPFVYSFHTLTCNATPIVRYMRSLEFFLLEFRSMQPLFGFIHMKLFRTQIPLRMCHIQAYSTMK